MRERFSFSLIAQIIAAIVLSWKKAFRHILLFLKPNLSRMGTSKVNWILLVSCFNLSLPSVFIPVSSQVQGGEFPPHLTCVPLWRPRFIFSPLENLVFIRLILWALAFIFSCNQNLSGCWESHDILLPLPCQPNRFVPDCLPGSWGGMRDCSDLQETLVTNSSYLPRGTVLVKSGNARLTNCS